MNISNSIIESIIIRCELHTMHHLTHNLVCTVNKSDYLKYTTFYRTI